MKKTLGDILPLNQADAECDAERLLGLLRHFRITDSHPEQWLVLANALARKHYPQGAPNPIGRPGRGSIAKLYHLGRKRGRPKKHPPEGPVRPRGRPGKWREIIEAIHPLVEKHKEAHPGATDKAAITALLKELGLLEYLGPLQKALSRYRGELRRLSP